MPSLDVFNADAFSVFSMTDAITKLPFVPARLGQSGLFKMTGITTTSAAVEERGGRLALIPTAARGSMPNVMSKGRRKVRIFQVPHIPLNEAVMADDVQNVRAFGSETEMDSVNNLVNDKLGDMKQNLEVTKEWHRIGALQGTILDADGTTVIYDLFDEFGLTQQEVAFAFDGAEEIRMKGLAVKRLMERTLGATPFSGIRAMCGQNFFDQLLTDETVKHAFEVGLSETNSRFFTDIPNRNGFEFANIIWEEYVGYIGETEFFDTDSCIFYPTGVPGLFQEIYSPAPFIETVNTTGKPFYAKQKIMDWDVGVELHAQTNPLMMCGRPAVLIKGTMSGSGHTFSVEELPGSTGEDLTFEE